MNRASVLLFPPSDLSACLFAAILRDTRDVVLSDEDRYNFFPASPLVCVTLVIEGELRFVPFDEHLDAVRSAPPSPGAFVVPPQDVPTVSWSPGPVFAVSIGFFADAWARIGDGQRVMDLLGEAFGHADGPQHGWERFCTAVSPLCRPAADNRSLAQAGIARISGWSHALLARAALSGPGRSARSIERRVKRWTGQTRRSLDFYSTFEDLHRISARSDDNSLADLALQAGYADQSHMGRAVRRGTGFSPARLNQLITTKEAFWCYRLLGERY